MNQSNFDVEAAVKAIKTTIFLFIGIPVLIWVVVMLYVLSIFASVGIYFWLKSTFGLDIDPRIINGVLLLFILAVISLIALKVFKHILKGYKKDSAYERAIKKLELFNATGDER